MLLKILTKKAKVLRQKAEPITKIDSKILQLAQDMTETTKANLGLGLAGPQVNHSKRIIVVQDDVLINPEIIASSQEEEVQEEGCLSLPGLYGLVRRAKSVKVKAIKLSPQNHFRPSKTTLTFSGLPARIVQHEIDHLDGILFTDRVEEITSLKRKPLPFKIVFFGTPEFAAFILEGLIQAGWPISLVVTEPRKPVGRKHLLLPLPVEVVAQKNQLLVYQPEKLNQLENSLLNLKPDLFIVAAYGQIIPKKLFTLPTHQTICIHPSLLPRYRGPSPIQSVILDGQKKTGTTIFLLDEKLDHGPILAQAELSLDERETSQSLSQKLAELSRNLLLKTLPLWLQGELKPKPQNHRQATYTRLIQKEDGYLPLETLNSLDPKTIRQIERKIRAFYPWPKVWTEIKGERVLIHQAHLENGRLVLEIVQPAGKKPMPYQEYLKGHPPLIQAEQSEKMTLSRNKK